MKVGDRFGNLVVIDIVEPRVARVRCDCGVRKRMLRSQLLRGYKSCGCVKAGRNYWPTDKAAT